MIGAYHHVLQSDVARLLPERAHNGISLRAFLGGFGDCAVPTDNAWEQAVLVLCRGSSAGRVEGGTVGGRGRVVGGAFCVGPA